MNHHRAIELLLLLKLRLNREHRERLKWAFEVRSSVDHKAHLEKAGELSDTMEALDAAVAALAFRG